jgi:hypothetical protein
MSGVRVFDVAQFTFRPVRSAPQLAEYTDDLLLEMGRTDDEILELQIMGAVP